MFLFYYYLFPIGFLLFVVHVVISLFGGWRLFNAISFIIHHSTCPPPRNSHDKFLFALPLAGPAVRASCFGTIDHSGTATSAVHIKARRTGAAQPHGGEAIPQSGLQAKKKKFPLRSGRRNNWPVRGDGRQRLARMGGRHTRCDALHDLR